MKKVRGFRIVLYITVIGLIVQYLTGMFANLFVEFPSNLPGGNAWGWVDHHSPLILFHVILGMLLVVLTIVSLVLAFIIKDRASITFTILSVLLLAFAWISGRNFLNYGQQDINSYFMAIGFLGAAICLVGVMVRTRSLNKVF